jgi:hypothetical protein|tara:strand:- start:286 stop:432 length:147 start_codon:yes stop_codon:yes gene_type:complete
MEEIKNRVWEKYMTIKGGDFPNWYEGLSPVEQSVWKKRFDDRISKTNF